MIHDEFVEKVGTISLLVSDEEYCKIVSDYVASDHIYKDDFLNEWREKKKATFVNAPSRKK